ncbi:MAG: ATP-binding protein [Planctomycetales bacterium]|nr:ATP-binding protein [Planctomycetales bacterium]
MAQDVNQGEMDVAAQVRSALVNRISSERYELWIPKSTVWRWSETGLSVVFASDFVCQYARRMFLQEISEVVVGLGVQPTTVDFVVDANLKNLAAQSVVADNPDARPTLGRPMESVDPSKLERTKSVPPTALSLSMTQDSPTNHPQRKLLKASVPSPALAKTNSSRDSKSSELVLREPPASSRRQIRYWESFLAGEANQLASSTASLIVSDPGRFSPIFIHGPTGCGKSHLTAGIAQQFREVRRLRRVVHFTSEQFTNDFTEGLRGGGLPMFRRKYRDVDALLLEDIQFFVGKKSTLNELRYTLDNLIQSGKQILLTSDRPIGDLQGLGTELVSRLSGGLITPIFPLDRALRKQLLERELRAAGVEVHEEVVEEIATRLVGDGRILSGVVNRLIAAANMASGKMTWDTCWNAIFDLVQGTQPIIRLKDIERVVCSTFGLSPDSLQSASKSRTVSQPRMLAMYLARRYTPAAYTEIGEYFGKRRHSTVISAEKTVETWLAEQTATRIGYGMTVRDAIQQVKSQLQVG